MAFARAVVQPADRPQPVPARPGRALDAFARVYVINLAQRADRRREMAEQLARVGLSFDHPRVSRIDAVRPDAARGWPTLGARGCFLSHLSILTDAAARDEGDILILEDDADWTGTLLRAPAGALSGGWDLLHGGYGAGDAPDGLPARTAGPGGLHRVGPDLPLPLTHCLGIRAPMIAALRDDLRAVATRPPGHPDGGPMHVDGAYTRFRAAHPDVHTVVATPAFATQRASETDIHVQGAWRRLPGVRGLLRAGRGLVNARRQAALG